MLRTSSPEVLNISADEGAGCSMGPALLSNSTSKPRKLCPISCSPDAPWPVSSGQCSARRPTRAFLVGVMRSRHSQRIKKSRFQPPREGVPLSIGFYRMAGREYGSCPANIEQFLVDQFAGSSAPPRPDGQSEAVGVKFIKTSDGLGTGLARSRPPLALERCRPCNCRRPF